MANLCETKFYKNYLHMRLQKEDEDSWISGEELQTDGSSDEEKHESEIKSTKKIKNRANKTLQVDKNESKSANEKNINLKSSQSEPFNQQLLLWKVNPSSNTDSVAGASTSTSHLKKDDSRRSQSLTESLNLENRWRPKRGSLKLPHLLDGMSADI